ncbi:hypothetical protein C8F01DRAFT_1230885 [Mycena amicta]|nr:hypothetical protein C8F01DRAFT_1230885 [Mycena amicta]
MPPARQRIPPEIWSEVFAELDKNALQALRLSDQAFAQLTRPHLFSSFIFHPHANESDVPGPPGRGPRLLPAAEKAEHYLNRLEFWLSDDIAPLVRSCEVVPWSPSKAEYYGPFTKSDDPNRGMDAFADGLARFSGLRSFFVSQVSLGEAISTSVAHMSSLCELRVFFCETVFLGPVRIPTTGGPRISTVWFVGSTAEPSRDLIKLWTPFLDPRYLRDVRLDAGLRSWNENLDIIPVFGGVTRLLIAASASSRALSSILAKFPAVEDLEVLAWSVDDLVKHAFAVGSRSFIGSLKKLKAPHQLLPILLPQASCLTHLVVHMGSHALDNLTSPFTSNPLSNLVSLTLTLGHLSLHALAIILNPFPGLRALYIIQRSAFRDTDIYQFLSEIVKASVLPAEITLFAFAYSPRSDDQGNPQPPPPPHSLDVISLRDAFLAQYPALTELALDADGFIITWSRDHGGYIAEYVTDDAEKAKAWRGKRYQ